ncbi:aspartate aminotransferase [Paraliobacillus quinghaiensis]|uniref:Aminotransferase n=1 Tax=Paraliobacillus quinghaiensis TaxID=470815 RepID=A0A917WQF6_9BACI|nr:pyridoxal phosphate-dependent aminotransferase [Paraliobacillus quinghaiensis]GGM23069.1 aspartate aminotransferase [Paraliobacillus quinghaiensis]
MELSNRVKTLTPSSTLAITAKAKALKDAGHNVIGLGAGEPDFNTPSYILDAATSAMQEGLTKYTPAGGIVDLKDAIINKMKQDQGLAYNRNQVIVTTGAKHALYTLFQVLLNPADEVIVPTPYWVSYPEQIKLAQGNPIFVEAEEKNQFKLTPAQLENTISAKTKAVIINSPSNPTGIMYSKEELKALGEVCLKHNILIISDEIYEKLIYTDDPHVSIAEISNQLKEQTIIINGVSKSHSMTGWRIGYAIGSETIIKAMTNLASHSTSNPTSIAQYAALAAYSKGDEQVEKMRDAFQDRLTKTYEWLCEIPGVTCVKPKGAFYLFPNVKEAVKMNGFNSVNDWVEALLEEEKVALVPGSGFGAPDNVRLSYVISLDQLEEAINRIKRFVMKHQL